MMFNRLTHSDPAFWDKHSHEEVRTLLSAAVDDFTFENTDPREALSRLSIPELWLYGGRDVLIPADLSIDRLAARIATGKKGSEYRVFPEGCHNLGEEAFAQSVAWIRRTAPALE